MGPAFNERVALVAFKPDLGDVQGVVARRATLEVFLGRYRAAPCFSYDGYAAGYVRDKAVPRDFHADLDRRSIIHPGTKQGGDVSDAFDADVGTRDGQRTGPKAGGVVAFVVAVAKRAFCFMAGVQLGDLFRVVDLTNVYFSLYEEGARFAPRGND